MKYNDFLKIIGDPNFDKEVYDKLINEYGEKLIKEYFYKYMNTCQLNEDSYDKCKYYLEDELNSSFTAYEFNDLKELDTLEQYLNEISQYRLLEPEEERLLLIKLCDLKNELKEYNNKYDIKYLKELYSDNLDNENCNIEEIKLLKEYLNIEKEYNLLTNKLIEANLRLVIPVAKRYIISNIEFLDLIQEGNLGIRKAIEKFDVNKGNKFSTYAMWWIRQRIVREIHNNSRTIKLPTNKHELAYKVKKVIDLYEKECHSLPSNEELINYIERKIDEGVLKAKAYGCITSEMIEDIKKITQNIASISLKIGEDEEGEVEDFLVDNEQESVETTVEKSLVSNDIKQILDDLDSRSKLILLLRFGFSLSHYMSFEEFNSCLSEIEPDISSSKECYSSLCRNIKPYTLEEIGKELGVTRERIRQIEAKALRTLRKRNKLKKVLSREYLGLYN